MLLKTIEITDFLSIKGTVKIDLDEKVTVLLGSNDHGKTNILKAVQHLNDDVPITQDEVNWDATGVPSITFFFSLDSEEELEWSGIVAQLEEERKADAEEGSENSQKSSAQATKPASTKASSQDEGLDLGVLALGAEATLKLARRGVGAKLQLGETPIEGLPKSVADFLDENTPRVELFKLIGGNLQDSVTADQINTDEYEFMQGIFFHAGLDPDESATLFTQDDRTIRVLDEASKKLNQQLRALWGQGTELTFGLRHIASSIQFIANDPAVKNRVARMSKRSDGVTQFFRVSMILHARREKWQANSYIYLFDEPGVFLHPQGQRDLIQVLEKLSDQSQIVYATHSLFMLNQNFPERHRLIFKDSDGTKVDQKPYRANWRLATDALGVYLTSNILFSSRLLLVEGDSDPIYVYELFRQMNQLGEIDADTNPLGVLSYYDYKNLRFLLQVFRREGQQAKVAVLVDGDLQGADTVKKVTQLCKRLEVPLYSLPKAMSIEDLCIFDPQFMQAVVQTLRTAHEAENTGIPPDLEEKVKASWEQFKKAEKKDTAGKWFKDLATELLGDEASKVGLARAYAFLCREPKDAKPETQQLLAAQKLCRDLATNLDLPPIRAERTIETK